MNTKRKADKRRKKGNAKKQKLQARQPRSRFALDPIIRNFDLLSLVLSSLRLNCIPSLGSDRLRSLPQTVTIPRSLANQIPQIGWTFPFVYSPFILFDNHAPWSLTLACCKRLIDHDFSTIGPIQRPGRRRNLSIFELLTNKNAPAHVFLFALKNGLGTVNDVDKFVKFVFEKERNLDRFRVVLQNFPVWNAFFLGGCKELEEMLERISEPGEDNLLARKRYRRLGGILAAIDLQAKKLLGLSGSKPSHIALGDFVFDSTQQYGVTSEIVREILNYLCAASVVSWKIQ